MSKKKKEIKKPCTLYLYNQTENKIDIVEFNSHMMFKKRSVEYRGYTYHCDNDSYYMYGDWLLVIDNENRDYYAQNFIEMMIRPKLESNVREKEKWLSIANNKLIDFNNKY